jgi:hypothetical protein
LSSSVYIPVIGPFTAIDTTVSSGLSGIGDAFVNMLLVISGVGQLTGVGLFIGGMARQKTVLVRNDVAAFKPEFTVGPGTVGMRMKF